MWVAPVSSRGQGSATGRRGLPGPPGSWAAAASGGPERKRQTSLPHPRAEKNKYFPPEAGIKAGGERRGEGGAGGGKSIGPELFLSGVGGGEGGGKWACQGG